MPVMQIISVQGVLVAACSKIKVLFGIFLAIVFLIVYGSFYPWHFQYYALPANPLWILLHAWDASRDRRFLADVIVNIALYVPLGMSGYLAFRKLRIAGPVLFAVALSGSIEMLQLFTPTRLCSAFDLMNNVIGSALGVVLGMLFEAMAGPALIKSGYRRLTDRPALALLFCWAGVLLFPFYPEMSLPSLRAVIAHFAHSPTFAAVPFLSVAASWFVAGRLLTGAGFHHAGRWLGISLLLLPAQFLIVTRQPSRVDFIGALAGYALFLMLGSRRTFSIVAWAFVGVLVVRGLAPFHLAAAHKFVWVPFGGFLDMEWPYGIQVLLEKTFYYGSAIWLLRASRLHLPVATAVVTIVLASIEAVQTHLPGRTAEITEPLLSLLIGCGFWALSRRRQSDAAPLPPVRQ